MRYSNTKSALIFLLLPLAINAQWSINKSSLMPEDSVNHRTLSKTRSLEIGENVPDINFACLINYESKMAKLSDFRGKLIILDFWTPYCTVCIQQFPKLQRLQKQFEDKIQIISIGIEEEARSATSLTLESTIERIKNSKYELTLPTVLEKVQDYKQNIFYKLFPWQSVPHNIWIDENLTLRAITDYTVVNESNISKMLANKNTVLPQRIFLKKIDLCKEKFLIEELPTVGATSKITGFIDSLDYSVKLLDNYIATCNSKTWHLASINQPVVNTYLAAYAIEYPLFLDDLRAKRVIIESKQPYIKSWQVTENVDGWSYDKEIQKCFISYEIFFQKSLLKDSLFRKISKDLDKHLGLKSIIENREMEYYSMVDIPNHGFNGNCKDPTILNLGMQYDSLIVNNISPEDFVNFLNRITKETIFINESKQEKIINIKTTLKDYNDIDQLNIALRSRGLQFTKKKKIMPMLILRDAY